MCLHCSTRMFSSSIELPLEYSANQVCYSPTFIDLWTLTISAWKQIFKATWKDFDTKFRHILEGLSRHKALIESQATILQFEKQQKEHAKVETSFKAIQESILRIQKYQREHLNYKKEFEAIEREDNKRQQLALLDWLSATDPILDHESAAAMRADYPSSGKWILQENKIKAWLGSQQSTIPLLWINGIPGAGWHHKFTLSLIFGLIQTRKNHIDFCDC